MSRVEAIAESAGFADDLDLSSLTESIEKLTSSSVDLDHQKNEALEKLRKLLPKPQHGGEHHRKHAKGIFGKITRGWRKIRAACQSEKVKKQSSEMITTERHGQVENPKVARVPGMPDLPDVRESHKRPLSPDEHYKHPHHRHGPKMPIPNPKKMKEIKAVLKEIRGINRKLQGFEGGFISEDGLKVSESSDGA